MKCDCSFCKVNQWNFHIGDRVVFSRNIPGKEMHSAKYFCENAGIRVQGTVSKETKAVIVSDVLEESSTVSKGKTLGVKVLTISQLEVALKHITPNGREIKTVKKFDIRKNSFFNDKFYPVGLNEQEMITFELFLKKVGASEALQIRSSVKAAIYGAQSENSGILKIFASEGIPSYSISEI